MGLFDQLFGTKKDNGGKDGEGPQSLWKQLHTKEQLDTLIAASKDKTQFIFKHSTRCGISRMALSMFEREQLGELGEADAYFLDLLQYRDISNDIAERFGIPHQSPQLLVLRDGKVVAHASHNGIADIKTADYV